MDINTIRETDMRLDSRDESSARDIIEYRAKMVPTMGAGSLVQRCKAYAKIVGKSEKAIITDMLAWELFETEGLRKRSWFDLRVLGSMTSDRRIATEAIAEVRNVSVKTASAGSGVASSPLYHEKKQSLAAAVAVVRDAKKQGASDEEAANKAREFVRVDEASRARKADAEARRRASQPKVLADLEREIDRARVAMRNAMTHARALGVLSDDGQRERVEFRLKQVQSGIDTVTMTVTGDVGRQIDWDAEFQAIAQ